MAVGLETSIMRPDPVAHFTQLWKIPSLPSALKNSRTSQDQGAPPSPCQLRFMAFTAEQKRQRRANASQEERDRERDRKRDRRKDPDFARQESESRKSRREDIMEAARAGDPAANASLDSAAQRAHKYRSKVRFFASRRPCQCHIDLRTEFFMNHEAAKALLQRRAEKQRAR